MIPDNQTNFLYLADTVLKKYSSFFNHFEKVLNDCNINFQLLPHTKDVWAVDYMPIQKLKKYRQIKSGLMHQMLTGKIRLI